MSATAWSTRCASGWPEPTAWCARPPQGPATRSCLLGRLHGSRRDRRRIGAGLRRARRGRGEAAHRADRRPVRGEEADGVLPGAARSRAAGRASGPGRRRPHVLRGRDGGGRGCRSRDRRRPRAASRARDGGVRDHDLGVPGADARGDRPRPHGRGDGGLRALGDGRGDDRPGHRRRLGPGHPRRRGGGRGAGLGAGRRMPAL